MNFVCPKCTRRYSIADDRVRGRTINVRCKACQTIIPVTGPANPFEEESTRALSPEDLKQLRATERALSEGRAAPTPAPTSAPSKAPVAPAVAPAEVGWYVMVNGEQQGPLSEAELDLAVREQRLTARTYAWKEGMDDWLRAGDIPQLATRLKAHARVPSRPAAPAAPKSPPRAPPPTGSGEAPLASLFDDVELGADDPAAPRRRKAKKAPADDPFAGLASDDAEAPAPGEATQFFMAQAGVNRRNPPWKIATFVVAALAVPALLLYILSTHDVVRLPFGKSAAPDRDQVAQEWESTGGDDALKAQMLGQRAAAEVAEVQEAPAPTRAARPTRRTAGSSTDSGAAQAAALYALDEKQDVGPIARRSSVTAASTSGGEGPAPENIAKVVGDRQAAFQACVEQELRRNPRFRGGKVGLTVTVGSSGAVSAADLDRRDLEGMPVGECLTRTAKKMIFASFHGDPVQLVIPLVLTRVN